MTRGCSAGESPSLGQLWGPVSPAAKPGHPQGTWGRPAPMEIGFCAWADHDFWEFKTLGIDCILTIYLLQPQCVLDSEGNESLATCGRKAGGNGAGAGGSGQHLPLHRLQGMSWDSAWRNGTAS